MSKILKLAAAITGHWFKAIVLISMIETSAVPAARAALITENDGLYGASSVVLDTSTGLYWLKPTETLDMSYSAVSSEILARQTGNFTYATSAQVKALFNNQGVLDLSNFPVAANYAGVANLIAAFGPTATFSDEVEGVIVNGVEVFYTSSGDGLFALAASDGMSVLEDSIVDKTGFFGCTSTLCGEAEVVDPGPGTMIDPSHSSAVVGSWLVASSLDPQVTNVPEPLTISLFGAGLAGAVAMRRRKAKA